MKKSALALALALGAGIGIVLSGGAAYADKIKDISCEQFLAMDEGQQNNIAYWVDGLETASSKKDVEAGEIDVGFDAFGRPVAAIVTACEADKKASLWEKIKAHF